MVEEYQFFRGWFYSAACGLLKLCGRIRGEPGLAAASFSMPEVIGQLVASWHRVLVVMVYGPLRSGGSTFFMGSGDDPDCDVFGTPESSSHHAPLPIG